MRIYIITSTTDGQERLVEAATTAQALRHVAQSQYAVRAANASAVARLIGAGVTVESARATADESGE